MLTDALGRTVPLDSPPRRIVSLVPSLTEYLFAIGGGARLVGVTDFCTEPAAQVAALPSVRGTKNPDRAAVLGLSPDLVLAAKEENRLRDVNALAEAGIPVYVTDICTVAGALDQLTTLATMLHLAAEAAPLLDELHAELDEQTSWLHARQAAGARPWGVLAFIWRDPWMAIGSETYADDLLRLCGAENLAQRMPEGGRYPRAELAAFLHHAPDVVLLPDEPFVFTAADIDALPPFASVPAVQQGQVHLCDGKLLTWYGPRTVAGLRFFRQFAG